ncbi:MAG: hypothetical protein WBP64_14060 [Nitrososphaeraceae archaeon]
MFDLVERLTALYERDRGLVYDPVADETIPAAAAADESQKKARDHPYL